MSKLFVAVFLFFSSISFSQLNFGAKTGLAIVDYKDDNGEEFLNLDETIFYSAFLELRGLDVSGEFSLDYYSTKGTNTIGSGASLINTTSEVKSFIPSLSVKYYADYNFNIKTGIYLNSTNLEYTVNNVLSDVNIEDAGLMLGMEAILYKGLFLDARFLIDLNKSDDINTNNILFGIGYKFSTEKEEAAD